MSRKNIRRDTFDASKETFLDLTSSKPVQKSFMGQPLSKPLGQPVSKSFGKPSQPSIQAYPGGNLTLSKPRQDYKSNLLQLNEEPTEDDIYKGRIDDYPEIVSTGLNALENYFDNKTALEMNSLALVEAKGSVSKYLEDLGSILIFIDKKYMPSDQFKEKLEKGVFLDTNTIFRLTPEDILPEIYQNPRNNQETLDKLNREIDKNIKRFCYYLISRYNSSVNNVRTTNDYGGVPFKYSGVVKSVDCSEFKKTNKLSSYEIIEYEGHCFNIQKLKTQFMEGNYKDQYTGKDFDSKFISMVNKYKFLKPIYDEAEKKEERKEERKEEIPVANKPAPKPKVNEAVMSVVDKINNDFSVLLRMKEDQERK